MAAASSSFDPAFTVQEASSSTRPRGPTITLPVRAGSRSAALPAALSAADGVGPSIEPSKPSTGPIRRRGRPLKEKVTVYGPPNRRGRRPKANAPQVDPAAKRPVGRPPKVSIPGGVTLSFISNKIFMPGSRSSLPPRHSMLSTTSSTPVPISLASTPMPLSAGLPADALNPSTPTTAPLLSPATSTRYNVIPDIDQERPVDREGDEEDQDDPMDGNGSGMGVEEDPGDDEDTYDDDVEARLTPRESLPDWILEPFKEFVRQSSTPYRDDNGLPPLYSQQRTFWFPQPSTYFLLNNPKKFPHPQSLYNPRFFLWDPLAIYDNIPCPNCKICLRRHNVIPAPRRIVDFDSQFWMIGYRYRCSNCLHPKSHKNTVTFRSWDPRIIERLPSALAAEFPAMLTHRSGIAKDVFSMMRSCFQNGMGAKQFSDALRVQHHLRYDHLHLQYLDFIAKRHHHQWSHEKYAAFLPFDDPSPSGPRAFTPSTQWLRDLYDDFVEKHRLEINQHMALRSAEVCAIDHSHKITKHVVQVNGERVFIGLLTITNEKGEIRTCSLVATKSHSQFELALVRIRESLTLYGHISPCLFYTDNMADKSFLEAVFASLRESVVPVEKYSNLEPFELPEDVRVEVKADAAAVDAAMATILNDMPTEEDDADIVVGFDAEWNVSISETGFQTRGDVAVIQIAYERRVYVIQISKLIARNGTLPNKLIMLLTNPHIRKAGRRVGNDLKLLHEVIGDQQPPFMGSLELGRYAKDRLMAKTAHAGLNDLAANVLGKCLGKNVSERVSGAWEQDTLTLEQLRYAACDAFASLLIYEKLSAIRVPEPLTPSTPAGTPCLLYSSDNTTVIARGTLPSQPSRFDSINISPTRLVLHVSEVLVPGAIVTTHAKRALQSFGDAPFQVVCLQSHVRTYDPVQASVPLNAQDDDTLREMDVDDEHAHCDKDMGELGAGDEDNSGPKDADGNGGETEGVGDLMHAAVEGGSGGVQTSQLGHLVDKESQAIGSQVLDEGRPNDEEWDQTLHSRVLKDPFHVFNMLRLSTAHGLRKEFARILRDVLFIPDNNDRTHIEAWAATLNPKQSFDNLRAARPAWLWKHCKRIIPPPKILYPLVEKVFMTYGPLKDATTQQPLFNRQHWQSSKQILELIRQGFVSDPPGIPLYSVMGADSEAANLPIYRCFRGTNFTEGGVHTHLRRRLPTSGVSVRHIVACLLDFVLGHNLRVGTFNSTGQKYRGHYSIWTTNDLQERMALLEHMLEKPALMSGWVNGNLYVQTREAIGILPIPLDVRVAAGMTEYNTNLGDAKRRHHYLAMLQGTRKAVLPIHLPKEHALFRSFMKGEVNDPDAIAFNSPSGPDWKFAPKVWNKYADQDDEIFYKLSEQLRSYYTIWDKKINIKQTMSMSAAARNPVTKAARDPSRSQKAPTVPQQPLAIHTVTQGFRPFEPSETLAAMAVTTSQLRILPSSTPITTGPANNPTSSYLPTASSSSDLTQTLARQRAAQQLQQSVALPTPPKGPRTCMKCGSQQCSGSTRRSYCKNLCQDCGKFDCVGRDSDRKDKKCWEVPLEQRRVQSRKRR